MGRLVLIVGVCLLLSGMLPAQEGAQTPPSDYGIGNSTLSSGSDANNPSFSPDVNQAITNDRGSTVGDQYPNPAFAGSSGNDTASAANAEGPTGSTGSAAANSGRWPASEGALHRKSAKQGRGQRASEANAPHGGH